MPIPADFNTVTVFGRYSYANGAPARGRVIFQASHRLRSPANGIDVLPTVIVCPLNHHGEFTTELFATDDANIEPANWYWNVKEDVGEGSRPRFPMLLPQSAPVDINGVNPVEPPPEPPGEILVRTVNGQGPDAEGNVEVAGGGGAVDSVNGETGVVVLDNVDVGAAATIHTHAAAEVVSGTLDIARVPTGTTASTVAVGNHNHDGRYYTEGESDTLLAGKANTVHTHVAGDVTSGTFPIARIPVGTSNTTVAVGDHTHPEAVDSVNGETGVVVLDAADVAAAPTVHTHVAGDVTSGTFAIARIPTGTSGSTVALGNHTHPTLAPLASPTFTGTVTHARIVGGVVALSNTTTIATDASTGNHFRVTVSQTTRTLGVPTNPTDGQRAIWEVTATNASGLALTLTTGSAGSFELTSGITSPINIAQNKTHFIGATYNASRNRWTVLASTVTS